MSWCSRHRCLNGIDYIKRVIGLPGDVIQMRSGILEINGVAVKKERIADLVIPVTAKYEGRGGARRQAVPLLAARF